jgi:hypothetical protein
MTEQTEVQEVTTVSEPVSQQTVRQTRVVKPQVSTGSPQQNYDTKKAIFRTYQIVWYILGVIEVLLTFRIVLKLVGANPFSGFTGFIYAGSAPFAEPFAGILTISVGSGNSFEWSTLVAMAVYAVAAYGIVMLIQLIKPTNPQEVDQAIDSQ